MTARTRSRSFLVAAAAAALIAPLAIAAGFTASPASAAQGPRPHEVTMYKVEKHVDLSGEFPDNYSGDVYLSCNKGDYALDGMWRVDHVDQANPDVYDEDDSTAIYNDVRDVVFYTSASVANNKRKWHYRFENFADGNAQVKLFLTCIKKQTEKTAKHKHKVVLTGLKQKNLGKLDKGDNVYDPAWTNSGLTCASGYVAVAPSFHFDGAYGPGTKNWLYQSYVSDNGRSWNWAFKVQGVTAPTQVRLFVGFRCLRTYVANKRGHSHKLPVAFKPGPSGNPYEANYLSHGTQEKRYSCDDGPNGNKYQNYKAMVAGWYIFNPHHTWYLGMDPRPKTRAYKFHYAGGGGNRVDLGLTCVGARTGKQVRPVSF